MKNKIIVLALVLVFLLSACAENKEKIEEEKTQASTQSQTEVETSVAKESSEEENLEDEEETDLGFEDMSGGSNAGQLIDLEDMKLFEDDKLEVRLQDLDLSFYPAYDVGASVKVYVKNKSEHTIITLARKIAFNDFYLPTSYDVLIIPAGESVDGIINLASVHVLEEVITLGEIKKIDFIIASYAEEADYKSRSETFTYSMDGNYEEHIVSKGEPIDGAEDMDLELSIISEKIYDEGESFLIPIYYMNSGEERVLSPTEFMINGEQKEQALGFQTMKKNTQGIMEVILEKENLEGIENPEIELKIDVVKPNGDKLGTVKTKFKIDE